MDAYAAKKASGENITASDTLAYFESKEATGQKLTDEEATTRALATRTVTDEKAQEVRDEFHNGTGASYLEKLNELAALDPSTTQTVKSRLMNEYASDLVPHVVEGDHGSSFGIYDPNKTYSSGSLLVDADRALTNWCNNGPQDSMLGSIAGQLYCVTKGAVKRLGGERLNSEALDEGTDRATRAEEMGARIEAVGELYMMAKCLLSQGTMAVIENVAKKEIAKEIREEVAEGAVITASTRNTNRIRPDSDATGDHTVLKKDADGKVTNYVTYETNPQNPSGFQQVKRVHCCPIEIAV